MKKNKLTDINFFYEDKLGKTPAYYFKKSGPILDDEILENLKLISSETRKTMRICLHSSIEDKLHNMIVIAYRKNLSIPHYHTSASESHHMIEGKLACMIFDKKGKIIRKYILSRSENFLVRVNYNECHLLLPISDFAIYHETNVGSFNRKNPDMHIPKWFSEKREKEKEEFYSYLYNDVLPK